MTAERSRQTAPWVRFPPGLVFLAFLIVAGSFVGTEHAAHLLGALPYLLLLACPLLHFFHHRHGGGHGGNGTGERQPGAERGPMTSGVPPHGIGSLAVIGVEPSPLDTSQE